MQIESSYLGSIYIDVKKILQFPAGLPGFAEEKEFVILEIPENPMFHVLQSVHNPNLAFVITDPYQIYTSYTFELDDYTIESLQITSQEDVAVFAIMTLKEPFHKSTINLKAPIVINMKKQLAKQYVLNLDEYSSQASIQSPPLKEGE